MKNESEMKKKENNNDLKFILNYICRKNINLIDWFCQTQYIYKNSTLK